MSIVIRRNSFPVLFSRDGRANPRSRVRAFGVAAVAFIFFMCSFLSRPAATVAIQHPECLNSPKSTCPANPNIDLAVLLDHSGSLDPKEAGESYNIQIEGLARALRDSSVIPLDGAVAVSVMTFAGQPALVIPLTAISSGPVAEAMAAQVEKLRCPGVGPCPGTEPCPVRGNSPGTNCGAAISFSSTYLLNQPLQRPDARRVLLLSTDGGCTDPDRGVSAARNAGNRGTSELDVVLIGSDSQVNTAIANALVFPNPSDGLPGATLNIGGGPCTNAGACSDVHFNRKARAFAEQIRSVLRSHVTHVDLKVTSAADSQTGLAATAVTLRRAIEIANAHGGETSITFDLKETTQANIIKLNAPLPPICAPGVSIEGLCKPGPPAETTQCSPGIIIDGGNSFCDGLLIRANRARILHLGIRNFTRAGVVLAPLSASDNAGSNVVEGNVIENNSATGAEAGVLVLDSVIPAVAAGAHNSRNTIIENTISGCATPIDLGGDGPTANDDGDVDDGPNTLLNFPTIASVVGPADRVTIKGSAFPGPSGPGCPGDPNIRVDVFAVSQLRADSTSAAGADVPAAQLSGDRRLITAVIPLGHTFVKPGGSFEIEAGASPTCGYTVTATDGDGNTSELSFPCQGFGKAQALDRNVVFPQALAGSNPPTVSLTLENVGCGGLTIVSASVTRLPDSGTPSSEDETHFFVAGIGRDGPGITVQPGQPHDFDITFNPAIPEVIKSGGLLTASQLLPSKVRDLLTLNTSGGDLAVRLIGYVAPRIKLINGDGNPLLSHPANDIFRVEFSIYDSDLTDVDRAEITFFEKDGITPVPVDNGTIATVPLRDLISNRKLVQGQSFTVIQDFTNAAKHPEAHSVQVKVFGSKSNTQDAATGALPASVSSLTKRRTSDRARISPLPLKRKPARLPTAQ